MGKSRKQTVGHKYHLGGHQVICMGPIDRISEIRVKELSAWAGNCEGGQIQIDAQHLFGGAEEPARTSLFSQTVGGDNEDANGISGKVDILMGGRTQTKNDYLQKVLGNLIPAFRGVVSAVLRQCYIGNSEYPDAWEFLGTRVHTKEWGEEQWYNAKAEIQNLGSDNYVDDMIYSAQDTNVWYYKNVSLYDPADYSNDTTAFLSWTTGTFPFGDNKGHVATPESHGLRGVVSTVMPVSTKTWIKRRVMVGSLSKPVRFRVYFDNSFTLWVNGVSVYSRHEYYNGYYDIEILAAKFVVGINYLTICITDDDDWSGNRFWCDISGINETGTIIDMNPAHWLRELYTSKRYGLGHPETSVNDAAITAAADRLYDEQLGISLLWDRQKPIEDMFDDTLKHIDGVHYVDEAGQLKVKLIRDDYDINDLFVVDASIVIRVNKFGSTNQRELINAVTVVYDDSITGKEASVQVADPALVQTQGRINSVTIPYPFFSNAKNAIRAAMRDLRLKSNSLYSYELVVNRKAAHLNIGDVFLLNLPSHKATNFVMRIFDRKKGNGLNNEITLTCTQDIYALPEQAIMVVTPGGWVDPRSPAAPVPAQLTFELPYYELVQAQGHEAIDAALEADDTIGALGVAAVRPTGTAINAQIMVDTGAGYRAADELEFCPTALLATTMTRLTKDIEFTDDIDMDLVRVGSHAQIGDELVVIEALDYTARTATVGRGVLDTLPQPHAIGARIWCWDFYTASDTQTYIDGQTADVKVLTNSSSGRLLISQATAQSLTFDSRAARPYPPGNFKVNGVAFGSTVASNADITFSWAHRDRLQQTAGTLQDHTYGNIGPEAGTTYTLRIYNQFNTLIRTQSVSGDNYTYTTTQEQIDNGGGGGSSQVVDPLWPKVSLLLNFNGANNSTTFTDASGNFLTPVGDAKISTSQYKFGGSAAYFDGAGDCISHPDATVFQLTGDFSVEAWIRPSSFTSTFGAIITTRRSNNAQNTPVGLFVTSAGKLRLLAANAALTTYAVDLTGSTTIALNAWTHVAATRSGNVWRVYINGVVDGSVTAAVTPYTHTGTTNIGGDTNTNYYHGYIDDLRLTNGAARGTTSYPLPVNQLAKYVKDSNWSDNILALIFEGDNDSTNIVDRSDSGKTISVFGSARLSTAQAKFGGSSLYLARSVTYADFIWAPFDLAYSGLSDFTVDCWVYPIDPTESGKYKAIASTGRPSASSREGWTLFLTTDGKVELQGWNTGANMFFVRSASAIAATTWTHIAFVRNGTSWKLFVNGVSQGTVTESGALGPGDQLCIGREQNFGPAHDWYGYIDEFRVRTGAKYSADFTPPTSSFLPQDPYWANTVLLCNFNGANNSVVFENVAELTKTLAASGNAKISTTQSKFGGAGYVDGVGDFVTKSPAVPIGNGDFTIEGWINIASNTLPFELFDCRSADSVTNGFVFYVRSTGKLTFSTGNPFVATEGATTVSINTWHHIALVRSAGVVKGYLNGNLEFTVANTANMSHTVHVVGNSWNASGTHSAGYIDDLRVTLGARYMDTFATPAIELSKFVPALNTQLRIELESKRDGLVSMQKYNHVVTRAV